MVKTARYIRMQAVQTVGFRPVLTDNLSNGDCFYSAIYRSLDSRALLPIVGQCIALPIADEASFIQGARNLVAQRVLNGDADSVYTFYKDLFDSDVSTLEIAIQSAPAYLLSYVSSKIAEKKKNPAAQFYTKADFLAKMASHVQTSGTWSGETEVTIFRNILRNCSIIADVYVNISPKTNLPKQAGAYHYIYLYNMGEVHWKHFILQDPGTPITLSRDMTPGILNSSWRGGKRRVRRAKSTRRKIYGRRRRTTRKA